MIEEWVNHSLDVARKAMKGQEIAEKAYREADKKLKETLAQLFEVEKAQSNVEFALKGYERQVVTPWRPRGGPRIKWISQFWS